MSITAQKQIRRAEREREIILFRNFVLLLPLFLCACDGGNARMNVEQVIEIESPLQNTCQPPDGHSKTTPLCEM